jgi:hypothetical protein
MKRSSARLIIGVLAVGAILALASYGIPRITACYNGTFYRAHCHALQFRLLMQIVAVLLITVAAWIVTRQMKKT